MKKAIGTVFQGASWQRCRVHFMRAVLSIVPKGSQDMVASIIRTIFAQPDREHILSRFTEVTTMLDRSHPKVAVMLDEARHDLCIRMFDADITDLATELPLGTSITIE